MTSRLGLISFLCAPIPPCVSSVITVTILYSPYYLSLFFLLTVNSARGGAVSILSPAEYPASIIPGTWLAGCGQQCGIIPSHIFCPFLSPGTYNKNLLLLLLLFCFAFWEKILIELVKFKPVIKGASYEIGRLGRCKVGEMNSVEYRSRGA